MQPMIFFEFELQARHGKVRQLAESDLEAIVNYWHASPRAYLESMGVDLNKLSSRAKIEEKFRSALALAPAPQRHIALAIELESRLIAYTNAYLDEERKGYAHVHILDPMLRGQGLGSGVFLRVLALYFEHHGVSALVFQTHPDSVGINRLLQSFGLQPKLIDDQNPSGMARAGEFNLYQLTRHDFTNLSRRAAAAGGT